MKSLCVVVLLLALGTALAACDKLKYQPVEPGSYFPYHRGPN